MKGKKYRKLLWLLACMLVLAGCGSSSSSMDTAASVETKSSSTGWAEDTVVEEAMEYSTDDASEVTMDDTEEIAENDLENRKLIKTVYLDMETEEFDSLKTNLEEAIEMNGGYVESSYLNTPKREYSYRSYDLTVRVPADKLDRFIETVGTLGYITSKNENIEDVTLTYVDMKAYKESLETEYEKVMELLENADELDQILVLESKLSELRYEINSYESKLRTYDNLIDYSTVHIYVAEVKYAIETEDTVGSRISTGFLSSLYSVRDFFVDLFVAFASNLPVLVVLAAFIGIVVVIIRKILKKNEIRRANRPKTNTYQGYGPGTFSYGVKDDKQENVDKKEDK